MTLIDAEAPPRKVQLDDGGTVDVSTYADEERLSVTAWDEHGDLVGLAWCATGDTRRPLEANVEVTPAQRRRGIGSILLRQLIDEAASRGIATMTWTTPADDPAARHLVDAAGAVCARRVDHGRAKSAIFVPAAATSV